MIDNLKDAITHAREVAEKQYKRSYELHDKAVELDKNGLDSNEVRKEGKACFSCYYEHCQLADWLEELQERREADRWIPVSERLPEYSDNYLVFVDDGYIDIGVYHSDKEEWSLCDAQGFYWAKDKKVSIVAWKPLPKPYESEAENDK